MHNIFLQSEVQMICIWFSWCHCHPVISCFSKIQNGLSFWYWPTQVVLEKKPLNVCVCVCVCVSSTFADNLGILNPTFSNLTFTKKCVPDNCGIWLLALPVHMYQRTHSVELMSTSDDHFAGGWPMHPSGSSWNIPTIITCHCCSTLESLTIDCVLCNVVTVQMSVVICMTVLCWWSVWAAAAKRQSES